MKAILLFLPLLGMMVVAAKLNCKDKCAKCEVLERSQCPAGVEKDHECGCCDVCSRVEGQSCDKEGASYKYGQCGDGLECRTIGDEDVCQCVWEDIICCTDGNTYNNLCQMMMTAVRENKRDTMEVKFVGPCDPGALIVNKPEYVRNSSHDSVVLSCEAIGFPTPSVRWEVTRANNKTFNLPGDDNHIVTASRGGQGKNRITAWLQIEHLLKRHEGDYTCIAYNEHREDRAKARIKVVN